MTTLLRTLRLLTLVVWVGGIVFFAFVLAPIAFRVLPSAHEAGTVVGATLRVFDNIGLVCGGIFWIATAELRRRSLPRHYMAQLVLVSAMMLATGYLHSSMLPAMDRDRVRAGGDIDASAATNLNRIHFEMLHKRSEQIEGAVLFCGLGIVLLMARESLSPGAVNS